MSVATEITRLTNAKASIKTAIEAKGVTVPASAKLDEYDDYIEDIPTSSGLYAEPDIEAILAADTESYAHKMILLISQTYDTTVLNGATNYKYSDAPDTVVTTASHTWDKTKDINGYWRWAILYSANPINITINGNSSRIAGIARIVMTADTQWTVPSYYSRYLRACKSISGGGIVQSGVQFLYDSVILESIKTDMTIGGVTGMTVQEPCHWFGDKLTVASDAGLTIPLTSAWQLDPDCLATFDASNNITGGLAYGSNITDLTGGTASTLACHAKVKTAMNAKGAGRWNLFVAALSARNWTVSPAAD